MIISQKVSIKFPTNSTPVRFMHHESYIDCSQIEAVRV
jgi:hypothetical protein